MRSPRSSRGAAALAALAVSRPQVVVTDLRMEGMDGMALFDAIHRESPSPPVVILTAHGTIPEAVTATRRGVFSLTKPFEPKVLLETVAEAMRLSSVPGGDTEDWRAEIMTRSSGMEELLSQARRVAASDASVCIFGASGTGKELLARAIHRASPRGGSLVAVNCGAIPRGCSSPSCSATRRARSPARSPTAAACSRPRRAAPCSSTRSATCRCRCRSSSCARWKSARSARSGAHESFAVDVRVIAATHRKLEERIASGEFREDLYYRPNVVKLYIPTLAERREDIPLLANAFLSRLARATGAAAHLVARGPGAAGLGAMAGQRAPAAERGGAGGGAVRDPDHPDSLVGRRSTARKASSRRSTRRKAFERDYLVHPQDHRRQRQQGRAPRRPQPHRVLPPARAPLARAERIQGRLNAQCLR